MRSRPLRGPLWLLLLQAMEPKNANPDFFLPDLCSSRSLLLLVLLAELIAVVLELVASGLPQFSWYGFALRSLFMLWVVLLSAALLCQLRPRLAELPLAQAASACYGLVLAVVLILDLGGQWLMAATQNLASSWRPNFWSLLEHGLIAAVLVGIALRYFYLSQQLAERRQAALKARIQALQSRIRPHFLFNSMNSIASLIAIDPDAAERAVEDLSALFRSSLGETDQRVNLGEEIELCRRYARIEQLRLGNRLRLHWQLDKLPEALPIPALILQPLLENAIYHGVGHLVDGGDVSVSGRWDGEQLCLAVENPLNDEVERAPGNGLAQANIDERLRAIYGQDAGLSVSRQGGRYRAELCFKPEKEGNHG